MDQREWDLISRLGWVFASVPAEMNKGLCDSDVYLHRTKQAKHAGEHDDALRGERVVEVAVVLHKKRPSPSQETGVVDIQLRMLTSTKK